MSGLFGILNKGYSGTTVNQQAVGVTAQNIANADSDGYTRERAVMVAKSSLFRGGLLIGDGAEVSTIERIHDEFVWKRYTMAQSDDNYWDFQEDTMQRLSKMFPDLQGVGTFKELDDYFIAWGALERNSTQPALKQNLADKTQALIDTIKYSRKQMTDLQDEINKRIPITVNRINQIVDQIAAINKVLYRKEINAQDINIRENEMRDRRDALEDELNQLADVHVEKNTITNTHTDRKVADFEDRYSLSIAGYVMVDGHTTHKLIADASQNEENKYRMLWVSQDDTKVNVTRFLRYKGRLGAMLDTAGDLRYSFETCGKPGKIEQAINYLDNFAKGLMAGTNRIYAQSSVDEVRSDYTEGLNYTTPLILSKYDIVPGHIDFVVYDDEGHPVATRPIEIEASDTIYTIRDKLNANIDDNHDNVDSNDWDDLFEASFNEQSGLFTIKSKRPLQRTKFSIQDGVRDADGKKINMTNFAGALGLNSFFKGTSALDMRLADHIKLHPDTITPNKTPVVGNFDVAQELHQLQYEEIPFFENGDREQRSIDQYYREMTVFINDKARDAMGKHMVSQTTLHNAQQVQADVSGVSIDEEFKNLIQFQHGYTASAKVIKTTDEMIQTLLALK